MKYLYVVIIGLGWEEGDGIVGVFDTRERAVVVAKRLADDDDPEVLEIPLNRATKDQWCTWPVVWAKRRGD